MKCDKCGNEIEPGADREHFGRSLCEDCYIDALSPLKACDPWAVHSAKNYEKYAGKERTLTPLQMNILRILEEDGAMEPATLLSKLGCDLRHEDLEREFAILRHMEKVRGEKKGGKVLWCLWF